MWQYDRDEPKATLWKNPTDGNTKDFEIAVPLKYLTLEMLLINCESNFIVILSENCVITSSTGKGTFAVTDTKF